MEEAEKRVREEKLALEKELQQRALESQAKASASVSAKEEQRKRQLEEINAREKAIMARLGTSEV